MAPKRGKPKRVGGAIVLDTGRKRGAALAHLGVGPKDVELQHWRQELLRDQIGGDATVLVLRGLLDSADIAALDRLGPRGIRKEHDRYEGLDFAHTVWRFEKELKAESPDVYRKVVGAMLFADQELWRCVPQGDDKVSRLVHPEVEYIVYDAEAAKRSGGEWPSIGPHVDNSSCVTLVAMLSDPSEFEGGINLFEDGKGGKIAGGAPPRPLRPNRGDCVFFRGERCEHALTAVTGGVRRILQIELCRKKEGYH